jgi:pimeloyl-ACP methyl ester carboxylesterase
MIITWPKGLALLGALALTACGAQGEPSTTTEAQPPRGAQLAPALPAVPVLDWAPCGEEFPGIECAVAEVPLDYDRPRGEKTFIALARIPAADQANRIGTLFINPGGPGVSGVDWILSGDPNLSAPSMGAYLADLTQGRFDVIGLDPRGVARSDPVHCFDTLDDLNAWWSQIPGIFPYTRAMERPFFDGFRVFASSCLHHGDRVLRHMSTADVARDLDLLRQAVGDERLTYFGQSYGSYLGETYAALFPDKIRALVIDGVLDPRLHSAGWHIAYDAVSPAQEWKEFLRLCDEAYAVDPALCLLGGPEGAKARYDEMLRWLKDHPDVWPGGWVTYDFVVAGATAAALYAPETWGGPDGYAAWLAAIRDIVLAEAAGSPGLATADPGGLTRSGGSQEQENYPNGADAYYAVYCADVEYPALFPVWSTVGALEEHVSIFGPFYWWTQAACASWPAAADRYAGPWSISTSAPVLVVGNYFDGITSYQSARAASRLLDGSRLLSYAGWGHTAAARSDCIAAHVASYLLDGTLPTEGTVCPAPPNPFLPPPAEDPEARAAAPKPAKPRPIGPPPWLPRPPYR